MKKIFVTILFIGIAFSNAAFAITADKYILVINEGENQVLMTENVSNGCYFYSSDDVFQGNVGQGTSCNGFYASTNPAFSVIAGGDFSCGGTFGCVPNFFYIVEAALNQDIVCESSRAECEALGSYVNTIIINTIQSLPCSGASGKITSSTLSKSIEKINCTAIAYTNVIIDKYWPFVLGFVLLLIAWYFGRKQYREIME